MATKTIYKVKGPAGATAEFKDADGVAQLVLDGDVVTTAQDVVAAGGTLTATSAHHNRTIGLDTASGSVVTLPAATGSGLKLRFIVTTTVTTNSHQINCAGTDEFHGVVYQVDTDTTDTVAAYPCLAADNFDNINMDGSTTGGLSGDWYELVDIASGVWALVGWQNATGTAATPVSAT